MRSDSYYPECEAPRLQPVLDAEGAVYSSQGEAVSVFWTLAALRHSVAPPLRACAAGRPPFSRVR